MMRPPLFTDDMATLPDDAEMETITRYTGGFMTEAEARKFEDRMVNEPAFFYRTAPMLKVWYARKPTAAEIQIVRNAAVQPALAPRRAARRHLLGALGSVAELRAIAITFGVAAAAAFLYVMIPEERGPQATLPTTVAQAPHDSVVHPAPPPRATPRTVSPKVIAVRPTVDTAAERVVAALISASADIAVTIDSLPPVQAMEIRVEPQTDSLIDLHPFPFIKWAPIVSAAPEGVGRRSILKALGDGIAGLWGRIRPSRTARPRPTPPGL